MSKKEILFKALMLIKIELSKKGFKKQKYNVYFKPRNENTVGWIGINTATRYGLSLNPVVGIINKKVRDFISFYDEERDYSLKPTIAQSIGYIMPECSYKTWQIESLNNVEYEIEDLIEHIEKYAIPWMQELTDNEKLLELLKHPNIGAPGFRDYAIPTVLMLMDRKKEALEFAQSKFQEYEQTDLKYALKYLGFIKEIEATRSYMS